MEVIDIGLSDLEPMNLNFGSSDRQSVNFGPGIELLMNDKKKQSSGSMNIDLGELDKLENELNELSSGGGGGGSSNSSGDTKTLSGFASNLFGFGASTPAPASKSISFSDSASDSNLGHATVDSMGNTKTWDGFGKMNDIPQSGAGATKLNDRDKRRKKRAMIKKLEEWYEKGHIKSNTHFNMESNYEEVEDEYETALDDKRKKDSVKLQGWWFMTFVNSIEYANSAFNPFDINLDGWGEQISEDIDSYEEIFSELHDKYKGGKLSPEISLLLRLGFSAAVVNFTNKALSSATPAFNDVIKQSPELMRMFTNATVSSMSQQSPGFAFANNMMQDATAGPSANRGPPPAPVETKNMPPPPRPGSMQFTERPSNRPDISMGRGSMFREQGVDIQSQYENVNEEQSNQSRRPQPRPEMRGPQNTDIDNILSGLKTKTVDIYNPPPQSQQNISMSMDEDSMISISSLKDMQNTNLPKKTNRRKQRSDKNTISLDI